MEEQIALPTEAELRLRKLFAENEEEREVARTLLDAGIFKSFSDEEERKNDEWRAMDAFVLRAMQKAGIIGSEGTLHLPNGPAEHKDSVGGEPPTEAPPAVPGCESIPPPTIEDDKAIPEPGTLADRMDTIERMRRELPRCN